MGIEEKERLAAQLLGLLSGRDWARRDALERMLTCFAAGGLASLTVIGGDVVLYIEADLLDVTIRATIHERKTRMASRQDVDRVAARLRQAYHLRWQI